MQPALGENLALHKNTSQSSTQFGGVSGRAVDGNVGGHFSAGSVTHTGDRASVDPQPWWQVDLEVDQFVGSIRIWNREDEIETDEVSLYTCKLYVYVFNLSCFLYCLLFRSLEWRLFLCISDRSSLQTVGYRCKL